MEWENMDSLYNKVEFAYQFTTPASDIPEDLKKDPAVVYRIDGDFEIKINGSVYFKENIALLEFYLYLDRWISTEKRCDSRIPLLYT
jgi:hypothetical protein